MVWFVILTAGTYALLMYSFQTKLTYGMICYFISSPGMVLIKPMFQTKLTYGMICYPKKYYQK